MTGIVSFLLHLIALHNIELTTETSNSNPMVTKQEFEEMEFLPHVDDIQKLLSRKKRAALTQEDKDKLVEAHNDRRKIQGASDMTYMRWIEELAEAAQGLADDCVAKHKKPQGYRYNCSYGQNIFVRSPGAPSNIATPVNVWSAEKKYYNYTEISCQQGKKCGHYTQVVRAHSYDLGCASQKCRPLYKSYDKTSDNILLDKAFILVCNYGPRGNVAGWRPFREGEACSECAHDNATCKEDLCVPPEEDLPVCTTSGTAELVTKQLHLLRLSALVLIIQILNYAKNID